MPIIKKCSQCGKEIKVPPSKNSKNNFCCRECYNLFHSKNTKEYKCEVCGKIFKSNEQKNANRFCCRKCYDEWHRIKNKERVCPTCGKTFIAKSSEDKYCSRECHLQNLHQKMKGEGHPLWKGGVSKLNDHRDNNDYKNWRRQVYERDDYKCVKCGSKEKLNAHHILSWKHYPELRYDLDNGITLCEKCHIKIHQECGYDSDKKMI